MGGHIRGGVLGLFLLLVGLDLGFAFVLRGLLVGHILGGLDLDIGDGEIKPIAFAIPLLGGEHQFLDGGQIIFGHRIVFIGVLRPGLGQIGVIDQWNLNLLPAGEVKFDAGEEVFAIACADLQADGVVGTIPLDLESQYGFAGPVRAVKIFRHIVPASIGEVVLEAKRLGPIGRAFIEG